MLFDDNVAVDDAADEADETIDGKRVVETDVTDVELETGDDG